MGCSATPFGSNSHDDTRPVGAVLLMSVRNNTSRGPCGSFAYARLKLTGSVTDEVLVRSPRRCRQAPKPSRCQSVSSFLTFLLSAPPAGPGDGPSLAGRRCSLLAGPKPSRQAIEGWLDGIKRATSSERHRVCPRPEQFPAALHDQITFHPPPLVPEDRTSKEIPELLQCSVRTVETHRQNISGKLELSGSHSLLRFAFDHKAQL